MPFRPSPARIVLYLLVAAMVGLAARSQRYLPGGRIAAAERAVRNELGRQGIPGLSVAIVADGRMIWSDGFGLSDLENQIPATDQTTYRLASIAKPITAVAVLQLVERGEIDLDAPIQTYLPDFPEKPWPITCRQLLAHLGGIRSYRGDELGNTRHYENVLDPLAIFKDDPLEFEPGTRYLYSTYGFNLLGAIVRSVAGIRYLDYIREQVFEPAGMEGARVDNLYDIIPNRSRGYARTPTGVLRNSGLADTSNKVPGGGLCGRVIDLARFAIALQEGRLLGHKALRSMYVNQKTRAGQFVNYGLGWQVSRRGRLDEVWHMGGQQRVSTLIYMVPSRGVAVILLSNLEGAALKPLAERLADLFAR